MWVLAALTTSIGFGINNTIFKWSTADGKTYSKLHVQFFFYLAAFLMTAAYGIVSGSLHVSVISVLLGAFIGILNANGNIQMSMAFEKGPASLTAPLIAANAVFPILTAALFFHEKITGLQLIGIVFMLGAALVIQYTPKSKELSDYLPWMLRVLFAVLSFGVLGVLMKTTSYLHLSSIDVLTSMYGGGGVYLGVRMAFRRNKILPPEVKIGTCVGMISILSYSCYFYALNTGMASIVFPIVSLNCLVVVLAGCYFYKESLKVYQVIGIAAALLGIVLTKI
ncbi:DMT family transporter [Peribacillus saganii]|uniref:DMT family transporter n=1 Tax=Peribacillus saganii TaxID=2303992 RepID=A0A372LRW0_9BACI|nr:DMT family transporter [Peribacillus saganii]RFU70806.1 DMT family transporter [Peribacillus saganii]